MIALADDAEGARTRARRGRETVVREFDPLAHAQRLSDLLTELNTGDDARLDVASARFPGETRRKA
jgi:hypothetical protein